MAGKDTERLATDAAGIARAAAILREGGVVAVPTETVYGLAARADSPAAVAEIYRAKGRPDFNPLIVHVGSLAMARELGRLDALAEQLAATFWPGPLTLVVPLNAEAPVAAAVTAGLPTIALRMPDHPAMRGVIEALGVPLAAPSANRSGAVSPTSAAHVATSLSGRIDAILHGGVTARGLESTIVAIRAEGWQLLRPGPVHEEELEPLIGPPLPSQSDTIEAPGQLASHYSPGKPVRLGARSAQPDEFLIGFADVPGDCSLAPDGDLARAAASLYACLHEAAASSKPRVAIAPVPEHWLGAAINDRLRRAAA